MRKPFIGITCKTLLASDSNVKKGFTTPGQDMIGLALDYVTAVEKAGGVAVVLPTTKDVESAELLWQQLDGIIISGGNDVNPKLYNERIKKECGTLDNLRDFYEQAAVRYFVANNRPIFGICRGIQLMNVALGGSIYQDLLSNGFEQHSIMACKRNEPTHSVKIEKDSLLFEIVQCEEMEVNSFHHQAVRVAAENMSVMARSEDGVIEAVSIKDHPFAMAVQWHPEMMFDSEQQFKLIQAFVDACRSQK